MPNLTNKSDTIPLQSIIHYRDKGLSMQDIGKLLGCSKQNVSERLQHVKALQKVYPDYKDHEADYWDMLSAKQVIQAIALDAESVKKGYATKIVTGAAIAKDKARLIRGESTANVSVKNTVRHLIDKTKEAERRLAQLKSSVSGENTADNAVDS